MLPRIQESPTRILSATLTVSDLLDFQSTDEAPLLVEVDTTDDDGRTYRQSHIVAKLSEKHDTVKGHHEFTICFADPTLAAHTYGPEDTVTIHRMFFAP
ncbi:MULTISPECIES: hypothetical protein [Rhodococcus]|uniref:Uncharacterized protein n=2 Tax=Rhodococcus opacus TaxID=37919 RepID=C1BC13_RHOOB|nr:MULTISPECIES: hypothetical protein [Rhodococcus]EID75418.1 hypothetical protein W59_27641 [Rhodococcus opacus RKJ300 = JCM 13270]KAF0957959.1 hypothetical protein MLGJGCBP_09791 [Rhodococcus sp. T7]KAF0960562.1 hypothetical protein MLGJGCBP_06291 [Rhodococcus sp. T7]QQZ18632.1 hypothetical protein GO592_41630 [Rhodococcus sp. 21391]UOT07892.1 hypothetical protein MPY17_36405 [Rhodococcus opacus]